MPEVSVIVPAFRAEDTIADAIAGLQQQTLRDIEIIVVDDASPDGTAQVVRRLAATDPRIVLLKTERNAGPGIARNLGLEHARSTWVALLDADDRYLPERLAQLTAIGEQYDADIVADNLLIVGSGNEPDARLLDNGALPSERWIDALHFVEGNIGSGRSGPRSLGFLKPIIRTSFLRQHEPRYPKARFAEDFLFYLECLLSGAKWLLTPLALYCYVQREGSLTRSHSADDLTLLATAELAILAHPAVQASPQLRKAIERHRVTVELAASWMRFATAIKRRNLRDAAANLFRSRAAFGHIVAEGIRTSARLAATSLGRRNQRTRLDPVE
jgi:succinoglycan biosynthesis protein ExoO